MYQFWFHYPVATTTAGERIYYTDQVLVMAAEEDTIAIESATGEVLTLGEQPEAIELNETNETTTITESPETVDVIDQPEKLC